MRTVDIYWIAGMLEGEGCFSIVTNRRLPRIDFVSTDFDITMRVSDLMGSPMRGRNRKPGESFGRKPVFVTQLGGKRAAGWMMTIYHLMGNRRRARIREILKIWRGR